MSYRRASFLLEHAESLPIIELGGFPLEFPELVPITVLGDFLLELYICEPVFYSLLELYVS
jgi:hypothetical protein